jgi:hypothetical protein
MDPDHDVQNAVSLRRSQQVASLPLMFSVMSVLLLALALLAGCGQVTHAGGTSQSATSSATQSQSTGNSAAANGCPSKQLPVDGGVFRPDVTTTYNQDMGAAQPIALTHGQRLEIHLDPTVQWSLTITDPAHVVDGLTPAGWYDASLNACVWRFAVVGAGGAHLVFGGPIMCRPNIHCTAVLERVAFDVTAR